MIETGQGESTATATTDLLMSNLLYFYLNISAQMLLLFVLLIFSISLLFRLMLPVRQLLIVLDYERDCFPLDQSFLLLAFCCFVRLLDF